jgi:hypothetical protein
MCSNWDREQKENISLTESEGRLRNSPSEGRVPEVRRVWKVRWREEFVGTWVRGGGGRNLEPVVPILVVASVSLAMLREALREFGGREGNVEDDQRGFEILNWALGV